MTHVHVDRESRTTVVAGALAVLVFGFYSLLYAITGGWLFALVLAIVLGGVAWYLKTSNEARIVRWLVALLAGASAVGFILDLVIAIRR